MKFTRFTRIPVYLKFTPTGHHQYSNSPEMYSCVTNLKSKETVLSKLGHVMEKMLVTDSKEFEELCQDHSLPVNTKPQNYHFTMASVLYCYFSIPLYNSYNSLRMLLFIFIHIFLHFSYFIHHFFQ